MKNSEWTMNRISKQIMRKRCRQMNEDSRKTRTIPTEQNQWDETESWIWKASFLMRTIWQTTQRRTLIKTSWWALRQIKQAASGMNPTTIKGEKEVRQRRQEEAKDRKTEERLLLEPKGETLSL